MTAPRRVPIAEMLASAYAHGTLTPQTLAEVAWLLERQYPDLVALSENRTVDKPPPERASSPEPASAPDPSPDRRAPSNRAPSNRQRGIQITPAREGTSRGEPQHRRPTSPALAESAELSRALRSLCREVLAPGANVLDEAATVHIAAETGTLAPVTVTVMERWLDLAIVIDTSISMELWRPTLTELIRMLRAHQAFRDVRIWSIDGDAEQPNLRAGSTARHLAGDRSSAELTDPTGRRLILIVTDGVGQLWQTNGMSAAIQRWANVSPLTVLNVLPERLWHRTRLSAVPVMAHAAPEGSGLLHGLPNHPRLHAQSNDQRLISVVSLDPVRVGQWASAVAGNRTAGQPMLAIPLPRPPAAGASELGEPRPMSAAELVKRFRLTAAPSAYSLATFLSAAPLTVPVMRLIQRELVPDSSPADLAEVFLSGLLIVVSGTAHDEPDQIVYDFVAGLPGEPSVREELLANLRRTDAFDVLDLLAQGTGSEAEPFGGSLDFRTLVPQPLGHPPPHPERRPFAKVVVAVLNGLGGPYQELAEAIGTVTDRPSQTVRPGQPLRPLMPQVRSAPSRGQVLAVTGPRGHGSGYLVAPRLVLTSAHVVMETNGSVMVLKPGHQRTFAATVVWCGTSGRDDAALVLIDDPVWTPGPHQSIMWGRTVTNRPGIVCHTWGAPLALQRENHLTEIDEVVGILNPGSRVTTERYLLTFDQFPPEEEISPWAGMAGAAVFCEDLLAGVIATQRDGALEAVPSNVLLADEGFRMALTDHGGGVPPRCEAIELRSLSDANNFSADPAPVMSPAALLMARHAVVPFEGREQVLTELHEWAAEPEIGVWLLHGSGGQGKTRLAHQFSDQMQQRGWVIVWLSPLADHAALPVVAAVLYPTLVVVDYADVRAEQVIALLTTLTQVRPGVAVKVLLLARTAPTWWNALGETANGLVREAVDQARVRGLPVLGATKKSQARAYQTAVSAFATALGEVPHLSHEPWAEIAASLRDKPPRPIADTVLTLQIAALADLLDRASTSATANLRGTGARNAEDRLLAHERAYWKSTATAQGMLTWVTLATLTDVVIATVLLRPGTVEEIGAVVERVPGVADLPSDRRETLRMWLTDLYPPNSSGVFEGLMPDRLAERLVGRSILDASRPNVVEWLAYWVHEQEAVRLLTVCARAAAHAALGTEVGDRLTRWCVQNAATLLPAAVEVATRVETPGPLVRAIKQVAKNGEADAALLERLQHAIPKSSQVLAEAAATIGQALVDRHRKALAEASNLDGSNLASSLNNAAVRLGEVGRREEGLEAISEAVTLYRELANQSPDVFLPNLASSLNNAAVRLGEVGRREEGLEAISEAVMIRRQLAAQRPEKHRIELEQSIQFQSLLSS
ncbi:SAV_2336 N-terminal domain-related protein [Amycolatopsis thailandensis]|uniref:SAV_2336 N-terminal domain-related protein n=1 Tax=Amycolatopsis thailandensis TaxID=589330 RepID=UPI0036589396